jgi:leucyl aminopeptidase
MTLTFQRSIEENADFYILCFEEGNIDREKIKSLSGIGKEVFFEGKLKESLRIVHPTEPKELLLFGLGKEEQGHTLWREMRSQFFKHKSVLKGNVYVMCSHLDEQQVFQITLGLSMAYKTNVSYKVNNGHNGNGYADFIIQTESPDALSAGKRAKELFSTQESVMTWIDTPSNIKTPAFMVDVALKSADRHGYSCKVLQKTELEQQGLHALLAVGQGSIHPPALLVLEYKAGKYNDAKVGLIGKGITFDTGGLSIKPSANMGYMKSDMSGAAAMIGTVELAARLNMPVHIVAVIPLAENSVDANSIRPGDVISSYSGKSIEVIDTDAEGRLILADALSYMVKNHAPEVMIDMATLTGNVIQSLGHYAAGIFSNDDMLAQKLQQAGHRADERLWRMPLWDDYKQDMLSDIADIKNLSSKPVAGSITAAKFLEYFTEGHTKWAHIDIAGVAFADSEYAKMRSATAFGVHLLFRFLEDWVGES